MKYEMSGFSMIELYCHRDDVVVVVNETAWNFCICRFQPQRVVQAPTAACSWYTDTRNEGGDDDIIGRLEQISCWREFDLIHMMQLLEIPVSPIVSHSFRCALIRHRHDGAIWSPSPSFPSRRQRACSSSSLDVRSSMLLSGNDRRCWCRSASESDFQMLDAGQLGAHDSM